MVEASSAALVSTGPFALLDREVTLKILSHLSTSERNSCCSDVCKAWIPPRGGGGPPAAPLIATDHPWTITTNNAGLPLHQGWRALRGDPELWREVTLEAEKKGGWIAARKFSRFLSGAAGPVRSPQHVRSLTIGGDGAKAGQPPRPPRRAAPQRAAA